ncbi:MAG: rhodanese-like domain-containing protein [Candidatus Woesearchaeota archaeon]
MKSSLKIIILAIVFGSLAGILSTFLVLNLQTPTQEDLIKDFYLTENAVHVSPHSIRKAMDKGDDNFILVDLRSQEEYEKGHIVGAVSIPANKDPNTPAYVDVKRIVSSFKELRAKNPNKDIVVYCYSISCMSGRKIGKMLAENGIYVKHLGIGWNEWRYFWNLWNHEHEWNTTSVENYIATGKEPGTPKIKVNSTACQIDNEFGC